MQKAVAEILRQPSSITSKPVIQFVGEVFIPQLCERIGAVLYADTQRYQLDCSQDLDEVFKQLSVSFLGQTAVYMLGNIDDYDKKTQKALIDFLGTYTGPHTILFFASQVVVKSESVIRLDAMITQENYKDMLLYASGDARVIDQFFQRLFTMHKSFSWHEAFLLLEYASVVGLRSDEFFDQWLPRLIAPSKSLFDLSSDFFAKKESAFFTKWYACVDDYSPQFWIAYWTEQVWRAYYVIAMRSRKEFDDAKKMSFRLPFSFVQRDWRIVHADELSALHHALYECDYALKNGASSLVLDRVLLQFFNDTLA